MKKEYNIWQNMILQNIVIYITLDKHIKTKGTIVTKSSLICESPLFFEAWKNTSLFNDAS